MSTSLFKLRSARRCLATQRARATLSACALIACAAALTAAPASAALETTRTYAPDPFFGSQGTEPGQFAAPRQIAIEPTTGNLLVTDSGNGRVQVLSTDAAGNPAFLTTLGSGALTTPVGIAVDPGTGAIYVSDAGAGKILRFTSDGAPTPTYTLDPAFTSPTELGSFASALAVDPTTHDLLAADTGSQEVRRFDVADGHLISAFNGSTSPGGQFTSLRGIAVAPSGRIYVVDETYPESVYIEPAGRVEQFDSSGNPLGQLQGIAHAAAVGTALGGTDVLAAEAHTFSLPPGGVAIYEGAESPGAVVGFPPGAEGGPVGVVVSGGDPFDFFVLVEPELGGVGAPGIQPFKPAEKPAAELGPVSAVAEHSAQVSGSVAPGTLSGPGTATFEYSLDGANFSQAPEQSGIAGPGETTVSADLTDLRPNTEYSLRLHIANQDFSADSPLGTFTTTGVAPDVALSPLADRGATAVTLNGTVNPFGAQTSYHFEYGTTSAYGSSSPAGVAGQGYQPRRVSAGLSGLAPSTTYHYRLLAENDSGANATLDATFTTLPAAESTRAYEQVTPVDKGGMALSLVGPYQAAADGHGIIYTGNNAIDRPDTASATRAPHYAALRRSSGWELRQLDVAQAVEPGDQIANFQSTLAVSADLSHALVTSRVALTPGVAEGTANIYRRDIESGALDLVATGLPTVEIKQNATPRFYGATADFSKILIVSEAVLAPGASPGIRHLYEWTPEQGLKLISRMPDGTPFDLPVQDIESSAPARRNTSQDLSRVYFSVESGGVYLREDGGESELISPPGEAAQLLNVTPDGRFAAYQTNDGSVYRYDRESRENVLVVQENFLLYRGMSDDGSSFFWSDAASSGLYAWHEGVRSQIASAGPFIGGFAFYGVFASPNGRYFGFTSPFVQSPPEGYDNRNAVTCERESNDGLSGTGGFCREAYLYDAVEQKLTCVSCPADGSPSSGYAFMGTSALELSRHGQRLVNDAGQIFFDTPTSLVAADSNGQRDVYEYRDGEVRLISPGSGPFNARLADASADGSDVFFATRQGLVGQDLDGELDLYDARLGGGLASQSPAAPLACAGEDCRAPAPAPVVLSAVASEALQGARRAGPRKRHRHRKAKAHHRKRARARGPGPSAPTTSDHDLGS